MSIRLLLAAALLHAATGAPASEVAVADLDRRIAGRLAAACDDKCLKSAQLGVSVRDAATGDVIFERAGDLPLAPASNMKLLTAAALQALLGPEHRRFTEFRADRKPDAEGAVGTLYVVGGGDPGLTVESLFLAARDLAAAGVRAVDGIVVDDSLFEGPGRAPSWPAKNFGEWYSAPCSALCANFNVVSVQVRGGRAGQPAAVWVDPFPSFFDLDARVTSGRGTWNIRSEAPAPETGVGQRLLVSGKVAPGRLARELHAVEDPALFFGHGLADSLQRVGVAVSAAPARGLTPAGAVQLVALPSRPMSLLVHDMNKESSNVFAETLLRVLGAELLGAPGTRDKGVAVLTAWLAGASSRASACRVEDGSGLSPDNRLTANVMTDLLLAVAADPFVFPELLASLPIGGVDGTLRRRLDDTPARRLVRAKTGRLDGAVALSGYAQVAAGRNAVFAIFVNGYDCPTWKVQDAVDGLVIALVADAPAAPLPRNRLDVAALAAAQTGGPDGGKQPGGSGQ